MTVKELAGLVAALTARVAELEKQRAALAHAVEQLEYQTVQLRRTKR
jgi:hypothetical protein